MKNKFKVCLALIIAYLIVLGILILTYGCAFSVYAFLFSLLFNTPINYAMLWELAIFVSGLILFVYILPKTLSEACAQASEHWEDN